MYRYKFTVDYHPPVVLFMLWKEALELLGTIVFQERLECRVFPTPVCSGLFTLSSSFVFQSEALDFFFTFRVDHYGFFCWLFGHWNLVVWLEIIINFESQRRLF